AVNRVVRVVAEVDRPPEVEGALHPKGLSLVAMVQIEPALQRVRTSEFRDAHRHILRSIDVQERREDEAGRSRRGRGRTRAAVGDTLPPEESRHQEELALLPAPG